MIRMTPRDGVKFAGLGVFVAAAVVAMTPLAHASGPAAPGLRAVGSVSTSSIGTTVWDTATLTNVPSGDTPGGTVQFLLYNYNDPNCTSSPVFTSTKAITITGVSPNFVYSATSATYKPLAAGTYKWTVTYSGDAGNNATSVPCTAPAVEESIITPDQPTITTTPSPSH